MQALPRFFPGGVPRTTFDPMDGTAGNGTIRLVSGEGVEARVVVSRLGRVRVCTSNSETYGLEGCP
jgi:type IV fimbrial biogenesis protein FimT